MVDVLIDRDPIPRLSDALSPPCFLGAGILFTAAMQGTGIAELAAMIGSGDDADAGRLLDTSILLQIVQRRADALDLQRAAIAVSPLFRIARPAQKPPAIRVLALVSPGDLMANTPLDFITNDLDVQLDLLFLVPGQRLPTVVPDHDVMFFAASEPDHATFVRMCRLFETWPRPVLNDPALLPLLARDRLSALLQGACDICSPAAVHRSRDDLAQALSGGEIFPGGRYPVLIRPHASHAGHGLARLGDAAALAAYLQASTEQHFTLTQFVDYAGTDRLYRKYRIAFIDREPHLCHMAVSENWMVHYLNAGMTESAAKRTLEAQAMAEFDTGFAARHANAFAELHDRLPFDYYSIDCAETPDGRLLIFEADTAAIIHRMDSADLFPYKQATMRRAFAAFNDMLQCRLPSDPARKRA